MEELGLVGDLAVVAIAAAIGGAVARMLRFPTLLGYLVAGLAIGPHTPGFVGDIEQTQTIADLGVALLMFTLGIRFSLRQLVEMRQVAAVGGLTQVGAVLFAGFLLGTLLGLSWQESLVLGMVASISSTMLALRLLEERGLIDSIAGRLGVTFALTQDLVVVVFLALIPLLGDTDQNVAVALAVATGKAILFLTGTVLLGRLLVPGLLAFTARTGSRELFIIVIVALALGTASVSSFAGLSVAFGAFLAGLVISESEYAHQSLISVLPLREIFAVVFFVAMGMLIDPGAALGSPEIVVAVLVAGVLLKCLVTAVTSRSLGFPSLPVASAALALANTGEFSFIITEAASDEGIVGPDIVAALLAGVFISLAAGAPLIGFDTRLAPLIAQLPHKRLSETPDSLSGDRGGWVNHVVICGYGQGAQELMAVLEARQFRFIVIDEDPVLVRGLRKANVPSILGDPSLRSVLEQASVDRARVLAVTLANVNQGEDVVREARAINRRLDIVARGGGAESYARLRSLGATEVVHPELELGIEFARHSLHRFGLSSQEIQMITAGRRNRYRP